MPPRKLGCTSGEKSFVATRPSVFTACPLGWPQRANARDRLALALVGLLSFACGRKCHDNRSRDRGPNRRPRTQGIRRSFDQCCRRSGRTGASSLPQISDYRHSDRSPRVGGRAVIWEPASDLRNVAGLLRWQQRPPTGGAQRRSMC